jgi:hypothetical protein
VLSGFLVLGACGPKSEDSVGQVRIEDGVIVVGIEAPLDTVFGAASRELQKERIDLLVFSLDDQFIETRFFDIAQYPAFDPELWDDEERMVKLFFRAETDDEITTLTCEPVYNPNEIFTHETEYGRLQIVPISHPGFEIAMTLTRRIAAAAEGKAVASR